MNRGTGLASQNRYFAWGSELRPWPGELEYLAGARLRETVKWNTQGNRGRGDTSTHEHSIRNSHA